MDLVIVSCHLDAGNSAFALLSMDSTSIEMIHVELSRLTRSLFVEMRDAFLR